MKSDPDIVVIGGGNAALCAAITAAEAGARVTILEAAPKPYRGGNSRHTRNFRCMHDGPLGPLVESYTEDEYFDDLMKVTGGKTDEFLARMVIRTSEECLPWMEAHGVRFQPSLSGTLSLARTNAFFLGGGKSLVNAYYRTAEGLGVSVNYEAPVTHLEIEDDRVTRVDYTLNGERNSLAPKAVIVCLGRIPGRHRLAGKSMGAGCQELPDPRNTIQSRRGACRSSGSGYRTSR